VESVLTQTIPSSDYELIVVNDSGVPLPEADWQRLEQVKVLTTNRRERSVARNTGAAIARGKYLHFLDDDDWVTPEAYQHFLELSRSSDAKWLYGVTQLVNRQNEPSIKLRHKMCGNCFIQVISGEWIPLQSSLIERKTFMRTGGFNPLLTGPEDIDLLRRILLEENLDETPNLISQVIMGGEGSTTDYTQHPQASRWARENILESPQAYARMRSSAVDTHWQGRMLRVYLTSIIWNLRHRRPLTAASRLIFSLSSMVSSGSGIFSKGFWHAVLTPYASITFENGFREAQNEKHSAS
jgi:glycosyltransferase involved in cell wall biosynthesis